MCVCVCVCVCVHELVSGGSDPVWNSPASSESPSMVYDNMPQGDLTQVIDCHAAVQYSTAAAAAAAPTVIALD